jgi:uncharacterized HhH-GPD family protein
MPGRPNDTSVRSDDRSDRSRSIPGGEVRFPITGDPDADRLLADDPFALLLGMLLDQQFPLERAFAAPAELRARLGPDRVNPFALAALDPDELRACFARRPALHRYPAAMADRTRALAARLVDHYDGRADALWRGAADGVALREAFRALPGFGDEKARILVAVLGKRFGIRPPGWREACAPFGDDEPRSAADVDSPAAFERVKAWKKTMRAQGRTKQDRPAP